MATATMSTYLANKVLDAVLNNTSLAIAQVTMSLHTGDPGATGANEVSAGAYTYARQNLSVGAATTKAATSDAALEWLNMPAGTVTHHGFWDGTNFLFGVQASASRTLANGDTYAIASGNVVVSVP